MRTIKIMNWNIETNPRFFDTKKIDNIITTVRQENPEVILLQEFDERYKKLALELESSGYFIAYDTDIPQLRKRVLLASKFTIEDTSLSRKVYEKVYDYSHRNFKEYKINIPDTLTLRLLALHVPPSESSTFEGRKIDQKHLRENFLSSAVEVAKSYKNSDIPSLIIGDLNLYKGSTNEEYLTDFYDSLIEITKGEPTDVRGNKTDYLFVNCAVIPLDYKVIHTPFSDHAPLIFYLKIRGERGEDI